MIKLIDGTNVYRWGRLILEMYFVIRRSKGDFCFISFFLFFYFILFYSILFYLWHSNQNLIEGKHILSGPELKHLKWGKNLHFSTLFTQRLLFAIIPWLSSLWLLSWRVPHTPRTSCRYYWPDITGTCFS